MRRVLHIIIRPDDSLAGEIIRRQQEGGCEIEINDLTKAGPDYKNLLQEIFAADSVECW